MLRLMLLNKINNTYVVDKTIYFINKINIQNIIQKCALIKGFILINGSTDLNININKNATLRIYNNDNDIINQSINNGNTIIIISKNGIFKFECFIELATSISNLNFTIEPNIFINIGKDVLIEPFNNSKIISTTTFVNKHKYIHQTYNTFDDNKTVITYTKKINDNENQTKISENTVVTKVNQ